MYRFGNCSNGKRIFSPMVFPPASAAPRLAASIIPGPPPEVTTNRCRFDCSLLAHSVSMAASLRASS